MDRYRVWFGDKPKYNYFATLAQSLKHIRKTKKLDESNSGLEENFDGEWDEWMDMDDQEVHDHLYMYGGKSPYLTKGGEPKSEPVRPSIMDTVTFSREEVPADSEDDDEEESEEDEYDEIIEPEESIELDEEDLDERLMNVIGVSPKVTGTTEGETLDFAGDDDSEDEDEDDFDDEDDDDDDKKD